MPSLRSDGVTVVVPSWNRPAGLARALAALSVQEDPGTDWEVVVVASASDPVAHRVVAEADRPDLRVVDEPEPGASNARNRGLSVSRKVVAFLDDDCWPEPDWLGCITAPVRSGRWAGCGGRVRLDRAVPVPRWMGDALLAFLAEYDRGEVDRTLDNEDFLLTANAAFDADALAAAGGFDPRLGPNAGRPMVDDDVDVCRKVRAAGGIIGYVAGAVVTHELAESRLRPSYLLRRMQAQGRSDWLLDRAELSGRPDRGAGEGLRQLVREQRSILRQGPWHRSVLLHSAGSLARATGYLQEAGMARRPSQPGES
ncbi:MAG TPA: glycosyltransferase [Acidimicrobiales bacterium]|nr:glycosyltransferase [Acidimicrobiales bacterium]